ncbi:MAG: universal stress protein [Pseudomonadota bacterium]
MTSRILVAVDLGHAADAKSLIASAARMAVFEGAELSVVTVLPDYGTSFVGSFFKEGTLKEAAEAARTALHDLADGALPDGRAVQCIVEIGTAYEKILSAADQIEAELIIVGASKPDLADRIVGPNAARVVRYARASVLVLR